jgi:hypothetical protein
MKDQKNPNQTGQFNPELQNRLLAYTTAAGLGAFMAAPSAHAQVTPSACLGPYPSVLVKGDGTGYYYTYHYMDIEGTGNNNLLLNIDNFRINITGLNSTNAPTANQVLSPATNNYVVPWANGSSIGPTNSFVARNQYGYWLASDTYHTGTGFGYTFNNFPTTRSMGFKFADTNGLTHFGYMNIQVNTKKGPKDFSAIVTGVYYNATPNQPIVAQTFVVNSIKVSPANSVTINFSTPDTVSLSAFSVQAKTSPDTSSTWTTVAGAVFTSLGGGQYQAVFPAPGGTTQYFRIIY